MAEETRFASVVLRRPGVCRGSRHECELHFDDPRAQRCYVKAMKRGAAWVPASDPANKPEPIGFVHPPNTIRGSAERAGFSEGLRATGR